VGGTCQCNAGFRLYAIIEIIDPTAFAGIQVTAFQTKCVFPEYIVHTNGALQFLILVLFGDDIVFWFDADSGSDQDLLRFGKVNINDLICIPFIFTKQ